tara:strand:- start:241 stop:462 length:222 start_codon:yes stop_codon:yes gene_type:complete
MHPLIDQGLTLALYGMSTVFVLLTLLVFAIFAMSRVLRKFGYTDRDFMKLSIAQRKRLAIVGAIAKHRKKQNR